MKYRVRVDLFFESEADAQSLMAYAKSVSSRAVSMNEGLVDEEVAFLDLEICRHDEGLPCERLERLEARVFKRGEAPLKKYSPPLLHGEGD